ncbi:MAG TPA: hypothetical protein VN461_11530 [Vicinamibacteria bacterium]|jgi:hypothetical protein|nr:hypothetical protein [Vicinamibacteria bacterium]
MKTLAKWAFLGGLVLAVIVALLIQGNIVPWFVAGLGLVVGFLKVGLSDVQSFLVAGTGLTVALIAIQAQPYNPGWLTAIVLYEKVFVTHALLVVSLLAFFRTATR